MKAISNKMIEGMIVPTFESRKEDLVPLDSAGQLIRNSGCVFTAILIAPILQSSPSKPVSNSIINNPRHKKKTKYFHVKMCHGEEF